MTHIILLLYCLCMEKVFMVDKMRVNYRNGKPVKSLASLLNKKPTPVHNSYITNKRKSSIDAYVAYSEELDETLVHFTFPTDMLEQIVAGKIILNPNELKGIAEKIADQYHRGSKRSLSPAHRTRVFHSV